MNTTSIPGDDFPLRSRLAQYAQALIPIEDYDNQELLELVFSILTRQQMAGFVDRFAALCPPDQCKDILNEELPDADNAIDLLLVVLRIVSRPEMEHAISDFKHLLVDVLESAKELDHASYHARTIQLRHKLNLGAEEIAVLEWGCCLQLSNEFDQVVSQYGATQKAGVLSVMTSIPLSLLRRIISTKEMLSRNGLISFDSSRNRVDDDVVNYLIGNAGSDFAVGAYEQVTKAMLNFEEFSLSASQKHALTRIVESQGATNLLFYGKPGTGKTELSKAISIFCNKSAVMVSCGEGGERFDRRKALVTAVNSVPEGGVVIVDEAEALLASRDLFQRMGPNKAWINQFMDTNRHKIIWIINDISDLDESIRRRFAYSIQFKALRSSQREKIWDCQLRKYKIKRYFPTERIGQLANQYEVSPGIIAYAVRTVAQSKGADWSANEIHLLLTEVLSAQTLLVEGAHSLKKLNVISKNYDSAALNTDTNIPQLIAGLNRFQQAGGEGGVNLLFWGWPGTGKTEFAKHLAKQQGKDLLVKRVSDLSSKWVGETEKLIAATFREAEENDSILFLDEADSLFINRQTANRSWETSQTNEILTQMENFSGILICCTNLLENLDEAAMRRFAFKIKFLPLTNEGKLRLYRNYFQSLEELLSAELEGRLSKVRNLCPGDIKAVWQRLRMLGGLESLSHATVIAELEKEVSYKRGGNKAQIGFG
jgi:SpoVK/Ycf46/Vps4 family AAA+-type ATPase